jgi:hypothetical protein
MNQGIRSQLSAIIAKLERIQAKLSTTGDIAVAVALRAAINMMEAAIAAGR